jgi:hypothetical protein
MAGKAEQLRGPSAGASALLAATWEGEPRFQGAAPSEQKEAEFQLSAAGARSREAALVRERAEEPPSKVAFEKGEALFPPAAARVQARKAALQEQVKAPVPILEAALPSPLVALLVGRWGKSLFRAEPRFRKNASEVEA